MCVVALRSAGGGLRVGRDKENDLAVESHFASRAHARIYPREGHFVLQDLSSNGTYLLVDGSTSEILLRREESPHPVPRRRSTAEQEEDALLDAQERAASAG